jgi:hypothetical protein
MKIRHDKGPGDCMTMKELTDLVHNFEGRYAKRKLGDVDDESAPKRRKVVSTRKAANQLAPIAMVDPTKVEVKGHVFDGFEFWVLLPVREKRQIEELIITNGGSVFQSFTQRTYAVIANKKSSFDPPTLSGAQALMFSYLFSSQSPECDQLRCPRRDHVAVGQ